MSGTKHAFPDTLQRDVKPTFCDTIPLYQKTILYLSVEPFTFTQRVNQTACAISRPINDSAWEKLTSVSRTYTEGKWYDVGLSTTTPLWKAKAELWSRRTHSGWRTGRRHSSIPVHPASNRLALFDVHRLTQQKESLSQETKLWVKTKTLCIRCMGVIRCRTETADKTDERTLLR